MALRDDEHQGVVQSRGHGAGGEGGRNCGFTVLDGLMSSYPIPHIH